MVERDFSRSEPYERVIATRQASPRLASHAPKVRIISMKKISFILVFVRDINKARERIMASKQRSDIRRDFR